MSEGNETYGGYQVHPAAALYPMMDGDALSELGQDIEKNGLVFPIVIHEGKILDGRNRARVCEMIGKKPRCEFWNPPNDKITPTEWVLSANSKRRHLTAGQKAAIAAEALPLLQEEAKKRQQSSLKQNQYDTVREKFSNGKASEKAAELTGANPKYVEAAEKIKEASPEVFAEVKAGKKTIPQAARETQIVSKGLKRLNQQRELDTITNHICKYEEAFPTVESYELLLADLEAHTERIKAHLAQLTSSTEQKAA